MYTVPVNVNLDHSCKFRIFYGRKDIPLKLFVEETLYIPIYKLACFTPHTLLSLPPYNFLFIISHITLDIPQTSVACFIPPYSTLRLPHPIQLPPPPDMQNFTFTYDNFVENNRAVTSVLNILLQGRHDTFSTTI